MSSLSFRTKFTYSLGQFSWSAKDVSFHYFLFFYYTQFLGLSASLAGLEGVTEASQMSGEMMSRLGWVYGPGLMVVSFIVALIYTRYPLSRARLAQVREQLQALGQ